MADTLTETKPPRIPPWIKKAVPVLVSLAILYYYFHDQDWGELKAACLWVNLWLAVIAIGAPQLVFWFFEALLFERHLKWFHGRVPFWDYF